MATTTGIPLQDSPLGWTTVAQGASNNPPNIQLQPGSIYRLTISLPSGVPDWVLGSIANGLAAIGLRNNAFAQGGNLVIMIYT